MEKNTQKELNLNEIEIAIAKNTNKVVKNAIDFCFKTRRFLYIFIMT